MKKINKKAFTLIELLVVVLIIGILAAIAVPKYQKAVMKTKYATLKDLTKALSQAQEIYFLSHGEYSNSFEELDIDGPFTGNSYTPTESGFKDRVRKPTKFGYCDIEASRARMSCTDDSIKMGYYIRLQAADWGANTRLCFVSNTDPSSIQSAICKEETGKSEAGYTSSVHQQYEYDNPE